MTTKDFEICALTPNDSFTLGRGSSYSAAIEDARRRASSPHSTCAMVLTWKSPLIRVYSRPEHSYGAIVPCTVLQGHAEEPARLRGFGLA